MKKTLSIAVISIIVLSMLVVISQPVAAYWFGLHSRMARDALEGLDWTDADIGLIPWHADELDLVSPHCDGSNHRIGQFQTEFEKWGGENCAYSGAEWYAMSYIEAARDYYADDNIAKGQQCLGYAIHYIQDSLCPPHIFPFSVDELDLAHFDFERYTWDWYHTIWKDWKQRIRTAIPIQITSPEDLRVKLQTAATIINQTYQPPRCSYVREDGEIIGDLSGTIKGWKMSDEDIGMCMGIASRLVKGAAMYARFGTVHSIDVFMLVDLTGSFSDDLPAFKTQAPDLIATLKSSYPDIRFGLGKFEDYPISPFGSAGAGDKAYERLIDLTSNADAVLSIIAGLYTRFGDDGPESQLVALYQAATGAGQDLSGVGYSGASIPAGQQANFQDGATKLFLLWTDAPFHHPGDPGSIPYPGPSFDETVDAILALDPPMVIGISSGGGGLADLQAIAAATGALAPSGGIDINGDGIIDIPEGEPLVATIGYSGQGIAAAIEGLVEAAVVLPIADAGGPYTGEVGETIVFDGSHSFDGDGWIVLYEWDFESDGVFDFSSAGPIAEHAYLSEFAGVVTLRVTDDDGNVGTDVSPVEVSLPTNLAPVADAGSNQIVEQTSPAGAEVTLDGSGSYDADGDPLTYTWSWGTNIAHGVNPTVELPLGTTTITLVVNDGKVDSDPDTVDITAWIRATIDFDPDTLNLKAKGKYVTVYIELPPGYDVSQIDISSIRLNSTVPALGKPTEIGDYDDDGIPDLMVKFHRTAVQDALAVGEEIEVTITGEVDGIIFEGSDTIITVGTPATSATRTLPAASVAAGANFDVSIVASGCGSFGQVAETLPTGFSYVDTTSTDVSVTEVGNTVKFTFMGDSVSFTYTVTASTTEGTYSFSGVVKDEDTTEYTVGGDTTMDVTGGAAATVTRDLPTSVSVNAQFDVTMTLGASFGQVVETLPTGFTYVSCAAGTNMPAGGVSGTAVGQVVTFTFYASATPATFTYKVQAPSTAVTGAAFSGVFKSGPTTEEGVGGDTTMNVVSDGVTYTLTMAVSPAGSGTTTPSVGTHSYAAGTAIAIMATAASG